MLFVKTVAEMIGGIPYSSAEFFSTDSWRTMTGATLLLFLEVEIPLPCWEEIAIILHNGGRVSSFMVDKSTIYLGPLKSSLMCGACPECLRLRIRQRAEVIEPEAGAPTGPTSAMGDSLPREILRVAVKMLEHTLSASDNNNFAGFCWTLHAEPLLCNSAYVVKSLRCPLCVALDHASSGEQRGIL